MTAQKKLDTEPSHDGLVKAYAPFGSAASLLLREPTRMIERDGALFVEGWALQTQVGPVRPQ